MRGFFICTYPEWTQKKVQSIPVADAFNNIEGPPRAEHISRSWEPIAQAERVTFVGDDGSIWLIKDRDEGPLPKRLRLGSAAKDKGFTASLAANFRLTPHRAQLIKEGLMRDPRVP
jgi:hypothetical protein